MTEEKTTTENEEKKSISFVEQIVENDLAEGKNGKRIQTRFPPEPNGYIHIGHAKAICMDFGVAEKYNGICNLRFDDTNPTKENTEYVENIMNDIKWLYENYGDKIVLGVFPERTDLAQLSEEEQREEARKFVDFYCKPGKPAMMGVVASRRGTPAFLDEVYRYSRKLYLEQE